MPKKKMLTENDILLLETIYKCDVASLEHAQKIYGNTKSYHYHRTSDLQRRNLITKYDKYIEITTTGIQALGYNDTPIKNKYRWLRKHKSKRADLFLALNDWDFLSSREIKRATGISDGGLINCYIKRKRGYAVYFLTDRPQKSIVSKIKSELRNLYLYGISGAIVFCPTKESKQIFGNMTEKPKELLMLPYPFGIELLKNAPQIEEYIAKLFPGFSHSPRPFADLEKDNVYISNLIYNDVTKIENLENYLKMARQGENREVKIICLESQAKAFRKFGLEQVIISERLDDKYAVGS